MKPDTYIDEVPAYAVARADLQQPRHYVARVVATSNATLTGVAGTTDGVTLVAGDVVLLSAQTDAKENDLWVAQVGMWLRARQLAGFGELISIREGTTNAGTLWHCVEVNDTGDDYPDTTYVQVT